MIWIKKHGKEEVLAACDQELLGKRFKEKKLELHVNEDFYKGELISDNDFLKMIDKAENINLVGEKTVKLAKEKFLIADVKKVNGIPYALIFRI